MAWPIVPVNERLLPRIYHLKEKDPTMAGIPINPAGSAPPLAPYSAGIRAGNAIYVSGVLPIAADGQTVGIGDVRAQTRHVLQRIEAVIKAAGGSMADVAMNSIFLKDLNDYRAMNEVYAEFFPSDPPARLCIRADLVKSEFLVEIASVAHLT